MKDLMEPLDAIVIKELRKLLFYRATVEEAIAHVLDRIGINGDLEDYINAAKKIEKDLFNERIKNKLSCRA